MAQIGLLGFGEVGQMLAADISRDFLAFDISSTIHKACLFALPDKLLRSRRHQVRTNFSHVHRLSSAP